MAFSTCGRTDMIIGFCLMALSFLLSVFNIQAYNKLDTEQKATEGFQFSVALITLIASILYFLFMVKDPFMNFLKARRLIK